MCAVRRSGSSSKSSEAVRMARVSAIAHDARGDRSRDARGAPLSPAQDFVSLFEHAHLPDAVCRSHTGL
jgi:hypothetical protein